MPTVNQLLKANEKGILKAEKKRESVTDPHVIKALDRTIATHKQAIAELKRKMRLTVR